MLNFETRILEMPLRVLTNYRKLLENFNEKDRGLYHYASTTLNYFGFAEVQLEQVIVTAGQLFDSKDPNITTRFYSYSLSTMYFLRTAMESSRALSEALKNREISGMLSSFRTTNEQSILAELQTISDKVVHPTEAKSDKKMHYEPGGMDSSANLTFYEHSSENPDHFELLEVNVKKMFSILHDYLEGLAPLLLPLLQK